MNIFCRKEKETKIVSKDDMIQRNDFFKLFKLISTYKTHCGFKCIIKNNIDYVCCLENNEELVIANYEDFVDILNEQIDKPFIINNIHKEYCFIQFILGNNSILGNK